MTDLASTGALLGGAIVGAVKKAGRMGSYAIWVGCAGWSVPHEHAERFAQGPSHLTRYATRFPAVEINSSFYRPHRLATYAHWAAATPEKPCEKCPGGVN